MRKIAGKTALVTGAASGIGRAIALRLADEGARVYLLDVNAEGLSAVAAAVDQRGIEAMMRQCDVGDSAQISAAVQHVLNRWGGVDILVNNAGITYYGRTLEMSAENRRRLLAVNLLGPIQLTRELLPALTSRRDGHVVNVSSICGLVGLGRIAAYSTTKFGLVGFSESLRAEFVRHGLGVTAVCPGFVDTNLFASAPLGPDRTEPKAPPRWMLTTPDAVARRTIRAIYRNQALVVIQPYARLLYAAKRLMPGILAQWHRLQRSRTRPDVSAEIAGEERRAA